MLAPVGQHVPEQNEPLPVQVGEIVGRNHPDPGSLETSWGLRGDRPGTGLDCFMGHRASPLPDYIAGYFGRREPVRFDRSILCTVLFSYGHLQAQVPIEA